MQSLKSTAFAVTLLAISFGLYCVSSDNSVPETGLVDPIDIDSSFATSQMGSMAHTPSYDLNSQPIEVQAAPVQAAPIQISSNPATNHESLPELSRSALPKLEAPSFESSGGQFPGEPTATTPAPKTGDTPLVLPSLSQAQPPNSNSLILPEIATRQPVNASPVARDEGLIDALQPNNDFKPQGPTDNSFNSLASAATKDEDVNSVKSADGLLGGATMPGLDNAAPQKPTPVSIAGVWAEVDQHIEADEYRKALGVLSKHYGKKGLTGPQAQKLQGWLDALAGKVIYSTEHHFVKQPYVVQSGETLESIARKLKVPAEVIYNINQAQFQGSNEVVTGMQLKVVNGPFHAEVDLESKMLTLFIKNLYAGRFPIAVGISGKPDQGNHEVMVKSPEGYTWRDSSGKEYPPEAPGNGYGPYWLGLSGSLCIHAVPPGTPHGHRGCIGLSEKDARDVYGILSEKSQISIVR